jgi:UPF0755 protein
MKKSFNPVLIIFAVLLVVGLIIVGIGFAWFIQAQKPVDVSNAQETRFVIPKGQSVQLIGERLVEANLIRNKLIFRYVVWKEKLGSKIQAGSFQLNQALSTSEIAQRLTMGTDDIWVTIPEGKRVEEVAEYFSEFEQFDKAEFIKMAKIDEGYLFPDTYLFPVQTTAAIVHTQLRDNFDAVVQKNKIEEKAKAKNQTLEDVIIMASLLEREAQSAEDMKMVAGILYNRLENGMPLQVDATLQYAKGFDKATNNWWPTALSADKESNSPYNTYKFANLPPGPIANPGLNALKAAAEPTASEYLFYITDNDGNMHYTVTYDEHLENVQKYLR